jgi:hypothetical protein
LLARLALCQLGCRVMPEIVESQASAGAGYFAFCARANCRGLLLLPANWALDHLR